MSPLHPALARFLAAVRAAGRPPFQDLTPAEARAAYAAGRPLLQSPPEDVADVRDITIPGPGGPLTLQIYRGGGCDDAGPQPCLLFLHGGGWVIGDLDSHDGLCRRLANAARCRVVAVDYRLAPEHPFPAALDDASAALRWLACEAGTLGIDPARLAIGGDSAGGNLAAVTSQAAASGGHPAGGQDATPAAQLLLYPAVDWTREYRSRQTFGHGFYLDDESMTWCEHLYLGAPGTPGAADRSDPRVSPLLTPDLSRLPPALVVTAGFDPLRDQGEAYAAALRAAGVPVLARRMPDLIHGFGNTLGVGRRSREAMVEVAALLRGMLEIAPAAAAAAAH